MFWSKTRFSGMGHRFLLDNIHVYMFLAGRKREKGMEWGEKEGGREGRKGWREGE